MYRSSEQQLEFFKIGNEMSVEHPREIIMD